MVYEHIPVLLKEVISYLEPKPGQNFVDATLGGGGYALALFEHIAPSGNMLAIDLDAEAIKNFQFLISNLQKNQKSKIFDPKSVILHHGNFRDIDKIAKHYSFENISGIVADIGLSSFQLDQAGRGLSFQKKEILDMRFNKSGENPDARFILNNYGQAQLEKIFREFGEEKFSRQIGRKILAKREKRIEIRYTTDLYQIITEALPKPVKHKAADSARRIFQALRIEVNHELENLEVFLPKAFDLLNPGGKLAIVSFHSLEDRLVKQFFVGLAKGCVCPLEFPQCICGKEPQGKILTKKPITASLGEITQNSRARPGKLRVIQKY